MFCVQVRRSGWVNVYIDCPDPVTARKLAADLVSDSEFVLTDTIAAYPHAGKVPDRYWNGDEWIYPETPLFEGNEA